MYYKGRRDSRTHASPERRPSTKESSPSKFPRLPRQSTAIDESGPGPWGRRGSQPTLSPDLPAVAAAAAADDSSGRKARRDSLSPDSASYPRGRRDSRSHLSPDRTGAERDVSPVGRGRRGRLRRQSTSITGGAGCRGMPPRSPESSSTCSSRDPSPCNRAPPTPISHAPIIRRQSTTEEILIARGFRRQSTTEEMIRCRNFRRQSSQSEDLSRSRGRRDSSAQIIDGTVATMTVETTSTFFDTSTQTGQFAALFWRQKTCSCVYTYRKNFTTVAFSSIQAYRETLYFIATLYNNVILYVLVEEIPHKCLLCSSLRRSGNYVYH